MNKTAVMVIGSNETKLHTTESILNSNADWDITGVSDAEEAIEKFHQRDFNIVVFTNGIHAEDKKLRKIFLLQNPDVVILQNDNDSTITAVVREALNSQVKQNKVSYSFVDDALKNAMLPITLQ